MAFLSIKTQRRTRVGASQWLSSSFQVSEPHGLPERDTSITDADVAGGILAVGSVVLKESPGWLLRKGREAQALQVLSYIRKLPSNAQYIQEEVALLRKVIEEERQIAGDQTGVWAYLRGAVKELRIPSIRFRFAVEFMIFILMNFSGEYFPCPQCSS